MNSTSAEKREQETMNERRSLEAKIERLEGLVASIEAAKKREMLRARVHPPLVAALNWKAWLHPRGMDGRFIEKYSFVDIFGWGDDSGEKRRARVVGLTKDVMKVEYRDSHGKRIDSPGPNFPTEIEQSDIVKHVTSARAVRARITGRKAREALPQYEGPPATKAEAVQRLMNSRQMTEWRAAVAEFNGGLNTEFSANKTGEALQKNPSFREMDFSDLDPADVSAMFSRIRERQDVEFTAHQEYVAATLEEASGLDIGSFFKDPDGDWSVVVKDYIDATVGEQLEKLEREGLVPKEQHALVAGGLPGAGKTSLLKGFGLNLDEWAIVNPDDSKETMVKDDMYPKIKGLAPLETAGLMHELSSDMAGEYQNRVLEDGYNMIADITMGGRVRARTGKTGTEMLVGALVDHGYTSDAVFVEVPPSMSAVSQNQRHLEGVNELRSGKDVRGGRYVPEKILRDSVDLGGESVNRQNFERMQKQGLFNRWYLVDNTGYDTTPLLIGKGADEGRVPRYQKEQDSNGYVVITLEEPPEAIPGIY